MKKFIALLSTYQRTITDFVKRFISGNGELTRRQKKVVHLLVFLCIFALGGFYGYIYGYTEGTGTPPFGPEMVAILPSDIQLTDSAKVVEFVEDDRTNLEKYDVGFNCVEYTFLVARNAHWKGISATPVRLDFGDGSSHMILGFPTVDAGWMFLQVEGKVWISPRVGGMFLNERITGIFYLEDFVWHPIEEVPN